MTKQIIRINGSLLRQSACRLRTYLIGTLGYTGRINSVNIEYGTAFHKFAQTLAMTGGDKFKAMSAAHHHFKTTPMEIGEKKGWMNIGHLTTTCGDFYDKVWCHTERDFEIVKSYTGKPLVESKFSIPYYTDNEVEVLIEGTIDLKVKVFNGCYAIGDYKTTSDRNTAKFFLPYRLSNQLMLYKWAVEWYAEAYPDSIYAEMCKQRLHTFVYGVFLKANQPTEFLRSDFLCYHDELMYEFKSLLDIQVQNIVSMVKSFHGTNVVPLKEGIINGACKTEWGTCGFLGACSAPDKKAFWGILNGHFNKKEYSPLSEK